MDVYLAEVTKTGECFIPGQNLKESRFIVPHRFITYIIMQDSNI